MTANRLYSDRFVSHAVITAIRPRWDSRQVSEADMRLEPRSRKLTIHKGLERLVARYACCTYERGVR